jgi:hypothetical protein
MTQEYHFCGNCGKVSLHEIETERQTLSNREKEIALCKECGNATIIFPLNEEEVNVNTIT